MKTDWLRIKQVFVEREATTYPRLAKQFDVNPDIVKRHAAKEGWQEARKLFQNKVQNLRFEKRSEIMASESAAFDNECLKAARKGIQLINEELDAAASSKKPPKGATPQELIDWIVSRKQAVASYGKALGDYQKAGRLAMGEVEPPRKVDLDAKGKLLSLLDRCAAREGSGEGDKPSK